VAFRIKKSHIFYLLKMDMNSKKTLKLYLELFNEAFEHDSAQDEVGCITVAFQVDPVHLAKIDEWKLQFSMMVELLLCAPLPQQLFIKDDDDHNRKLALQLYSHGHVAYMRIATTLDRLN